MIMDWPRFKLDPTNDVEDSPAGIGDDKAYGANRFVTRKPDNVPLTVTLPADIFVVAVTFA